MHPAEFSRHIFIISDGSGQTAESLLKATLARWEGPRIPMQRYKNVRSSQQLQGIFEEARDKKVLFLFTLAESKLREECRRNCVQAGIPFIDLLGPMVETLESFLGAPIPLQPGALRVVDQNYFKRIEAIEFTVRHDDGRVSQDLDQAHIILVGISRTGKTPLSIYLSYLGYKVANVPIVLGQALPKELFHTDQRKIIALTINEEALHKIRQNRLQRLGSEDLSQQYAGLDYILRELEYAENIFKANRKWPVINVSNKAIEETATDILRILSTRMGWDTPVES
jgi:hypothetical protein